LQSCLIGTDRDDSRMRDLAVLLFHLIATGAKLCRRGGARSIVAESRLLKHRLLNVNRSRERAPDSRPGERMIAGQYAGWLRRARLARADIVLKPSLRSPETRSIQGL
jgi:hypothetical protein